MNNWFLAGIRFDKTLEDGSQKKVTEYYLVDALSFTEAEARITDEMQPLISGEFKVESLKREKLSETFFGTGDKYYKVKVSYITLDERTGREKKTPAYMLVQASTIDEAKSRFAEGMKGTLADYVVESITETKVVDVFPYEAGKEATDGK